MSLRPTWELSTYRVPKQLGLPFEECCLEFFLFCLHVCVCVFICMQHMYRELWSPEEGTRPLSCYDTLMWILGIQIGSSG